MAKKLTIGLTGGIATGKTTYTCLFEKWGAKTIACDELAHQALKKGMKTYLAIVKKFGKKILNEKGIKGRIDRKVLAGMIFKNKAKKKDLESIIHPFVNVTFMFFILSSVRVSLLAFLVRITVGIFIYGSVK